MWPVQVAVRLKIPLIVWGAHQGLDQVGMFSHTDEVEMARKYRLEHDLLGLEAEDLVGGEEDLKDHELRPFMYPHDRELSKVGVRGIYLGNYIPWDSKQQHEDMQGHYDYEMAPQPRTFDTYNDVDCQHYNGLHDWIKFVKWGYGKVTDHATREVRLRRMSRENGIDLVEKFSRVEPTDKDMWLDWLELDEATFNSAIDQFRDADIWRQTDEGWTLTDSIAAHRQDPGVADARLEPLEDECNFKVTASKDPSADEARYVLISKGYVMDQPATNRQPLASQNQEPSAA